MSESQGNELGGALFAGIAQIVNGRGADIQQHLNGHSLKLEFADGQRILVNFDAQKNSVWLAARSGGIEFAHRNGHWRAPDQSDFFDKLRATIEQTIASNPLNARPPGARPAPPQRPVTVIYQEPEPDSHLLRNLLILLLAGALGFWAALRVVQPPPSTAAPGAPPQTLAQSGNAEQACDPVVPANASIRVFSANGLRTDGANDPEITLKNDHAYPLLWILSAPDSAIPLLTVLVHARHSATLHLPAGQYDMMLSAGNRWCNARSGFADGGLLKFNRSLHVQTDKPLQLAAQSSGAGATDFQLFVHSAAPEVEMPKPTFSGDGSMEVPRAANGHFYLPGSIENVPVTFMVDTGATVTSLSASLARQAGIYNCKEMQFQTANGAATGCIALVPRMKLGNFELQNITVAVMPNMEVNLLGANVLRNFQISQNDSSMLIGLR